MNWDILQGDAKEVLSDLESESAQTCVTSPPYWGLRDYGVEGQLGLEDSPEEYTQNLIEIFEEVHRVLTKDGTLWLNLGDCYTSGGRSTYDSDKKDTKDGRAGDSRPPQPSNLKEKDLVGIPWRVAFALQEKGWYLRSDIIWRKTNPLPESVKDRPTSSHEHIFLLTKSPKYYYDYKAIKEPVKESSLKRAKRGRSANHKWSGSPSGQTEHTLNQPSEETATTSPEGRNKRDVWDVATKPFPEAHFAVYPPDLIEPCILAGSAEGDTVLDPFAGAGTTGVVALQHSRDFVGVELNPEYIDIATTRIQNTLLDNQNVWDDEQPDVNIEQPGDPTDDDSFGDYLNNL